ncbi:hypothetical protein N9059_01490 [bacterium]|nr:hypothetical protein [bacterium]
MKTPREHLLDRRSDAGPDLDSIRERAVAELKASTQERSVSVGLTPSWYEFFLTEWVRPFRLLWSGLVACWGVIMILNIGASVGNEVANTVLPTPVSESIHEKIRERQLLMVQLVNDEPEKWETFPDPPNSALKPRSDRRRIHPLSAQFA